MSKIIIGIDCDFENYFPFKNKIIFNETVFFRHLNITVKLINSLNLKANFFIHTSPFIRKFHNNIFFTEQKYLKLWQELYIRGNDIGLHPHEESTDGKFFYYNITYHINDIIKKCINNLKKICINPISIRMGYFCLTEWNIPVVEKNNIYYSLDNSLGYIKECKSDWTDAPMKVYSPDYLNKKKIGKSNLKIIPLGANKENTLWQGLIPEANSLKHTFNLIDDISEQKNNIFNCLIHCYNVEHNYNKIKECLLKIKDNFEVTTTRQLRKNEITV